MRAAVALAGRLVVHDHGAIVREVGGDGAGVGETAAGRTKTN